MSSRIDRTIRLVKLVLWLGLVTWGAGALWYIQQSRQTGAVLENALEEAWPENGRPQFGTRAKLLAASKNLGAGDFHAIEVELAPTLAPTAEQTNAAHGFFAKSTQLRKRFVAATNLGRSFQQDGIDMTVVRDALTRALLAAAREDTTVVEARIEFAERALEATDLGTDVGDATVGIAAVTESIRQIEPAFRLGQDLMTEGHAAARKLVARASWHVASEEYRQAAALVQMAADLLAVHPPAPPVAVTATPKWFDELAASPSQDVSDARAIAAVELCEAMGRSSASKPLAALVKKARRELDADRPAEAYWWASVSLSALGLNENAIVDATSADTIENETPDR